MLHVWSGVAQVSATVEGPGRLDLYAVKHAGVATPLLVAEAYGAEGLVAAGELQVWELNQAIAALVSRSGQARRLALRDDGRGHGGYLDVLAEGAVVQLAATSAVGRLRTELSASARGLAADLNTVLRHYLALTRSAAPRTIVLPDASAGPLLADEPAVALIRPVP